MTDKQLRIKNLCCFVIFILPLGIKKTNILEKAHFKRPKLLSERTPLKRGGTMFVLYEILITEYTIIIETNFYSNFLN